MQGVYYQVDDHVTYNTLDAWQHIISGAREWRLNLFETSFAALDWSTEPSASFDDLLRARINSITQRYPRTRLWYSAGRDSHCVLEAFVRAQVKIDEIFFVRWSFVDSVRDEYQIVSDTVREMFKDTDIPLPKITLFVPDHQDYRVYWNLVSRNQHSGGLGSNLGYNVNSFSAILDSFPQLQDPNTCNLFGLEKPRLNIVGTEIFYQITDLSVHHAMSPLHNIEWFFLNDQVPELVIKQCHMLLRRARWLARDQFQGDLTSALARLQHDVRRYDDLCLCLGLGPAVSLQTGDGRNKNFGLENPTYQSLHRVSDRESWDSRSAYTRFCANITDIIHSYIDREPSHPTNRVVGINSRRYKVGDVSLLT